MGRLLDIARTNEVADELAALQQQGDALVTQLIGLRASLLSLKQTVAAEDTFDADDAAEVQGVIAGFANRIKKDVLGL